MTQNSLVSLDHILQVMIVQSFPWIFKNIQLSMWQYIRIPDSSIFCGTGESEYQLFCNSYTFPFGIKNHHKNLNLYTLKFIQYWKCITWYITMNYRDIQNLPWHVLLYKNHISTTGTQNWMQKYVLITNHWIAELVDQPWARPLWFWLLWCLEQQIYGFPKNCYSDQSCSDTVQC